MIRREFIILFGGAAAGTGPLLRPLAARAQQPEMPVIGFLHSASRGPFESMLVGFRKGLDEMGFVEGRNLTIEYRWADGRFDRLPALAAELVQRRVAVIVAAGGNVSVLAARGATLTIPIVFPGMDDPVKQGVVASFSHPGGNATGVSLFNAVLGAKRLELLRGLVPQASVIALLVNPANPTTQDQVRDMEEAARASNVHLQVVNARSATDIDLAFAAMKEYHAAALVIGADPLLLNQRDHLIVLAARDQLPTLYSQREFAIIGGLVSYGIDFPENYRQGGLYAGRILKGEKPADLPVVQPTKFELVINLKTAKALGLEVPPQLLARADEVIE